MYSVCGLRLDSNIGVRSAADDEFYLRLTVDKMHMFAIFTKKYLQPYGFSCTSFTAAVYCTNPNAETQNEIIEIEIVEAQIYNHSHNILKLFDALLNFPFTTSGTMHDYYLKTRYIRVASQVAIPLKASFNTFSQIS